MNDDDIQQIFFVECDESLEAAENGLNACKAGTHDDETINAIFRAVHSVKGGAGAFGYGAMQAYTHCFENLLGEIREGIVELNGELVDLLLIALDLLNMHVEAARSGNEPPDDKDLMARLEAAQAANNGAGVSDAAGPAEAPVVNSAEPSGASADVLDDLDALLDELSAPPAADIAPEAAPWLVHIRPNSGAMANGNEPLLWLRELASLGGRCVACEIRDLPAIDRFSVEEGYLGWTFEMPGTLERDEVADIFDFVGEDCSVAYGDEGMPPVRLSQQEGAETPKPAASATAGAPADPGKPSPLSPSAPSDAAQIESSASTAPGSEAAKAAADSKQAATNSSAQGNQSVRIDLKKLDNLIDGVGELVIAQAMLTQRLENENFAHIEELAMLDTLVRDIQEHAMAFRAQPISSVFGRVPRLLRELGNNTGKHVKLNAAGETTELDKTVIERLSEPMTHLIRNAVDHGIEPPEERQAAGKDPEGTLTLSAEQKAGRIIIQISDDGRGIDAAKLRAKAVTNGLISQDAQLSDEEIYQLVFAPGLSTAKEVSNISGRGVGMDVVKQNVKDLGGRITIESRPGKGTTFTLALPLTLAISDGMIVQVGEQSLVIPLAHVIESLRPNAGEVKGMGTSRQMLNVRGQFVPIVSLGAMTGAADMVQDPSKGVLVMVETESHGQAALLVDSISDQRQFVIKSLDAHYRAVDSVAGATILGNGQVALIVDVDFLVQSASGSRLDQPAALVAAV